MKTKFQFVFLMLITTVFVASCATPETITKKEEVVLNQVEIFNPEYPDGVPIKFLKAARHSFR